MSTVQDLVAHKLVPNAPTSELRQHDGVVDDKGPFTTVPMGALWRVLPDELVGDIFVLTNEQDSTYTSPSTISCVCSEWEAIALSTPCLWARIKFDRHSGINTARSWLQRSKAAPLFVECSWTVEDLEREIIPGAMAMLKPHLGRVVELDILGYDGDQINEVVTGLSSPVPNLRVFKLQGSHYDDSSFFIPDTLLQSIFGGRDLPFLDELLIISPRSLWPIGWMKNLTSLTIATVARAPTSRLLYLLEDAPSLALLRIWDRRTTRIPEPPKSPDPLAHIITLPAVTHIHFEGWFEHLLPIFDFLNLPKVQFLCLGFKTLANMTQYALVNTMPFPLLETLQFAIDSDDSSHTVAPHITRILERCQSATHMNLKHTAIPLHALNQNMHGVTAAKGGRVLCPQLTHLRMFDFDPDVNDNQGQVLCAFLGQRVAETAWVTPIEELSFAECTNITKEKVMEYIPLVKLVKHENIFYSPNQPT